MNLKFNFLKPNKNNGKLRQTRSIAMCALGATADINIESPDIPPSITPNGCKKRITPMALIKPAIISIKILTGEILVSFLLILNNHIKFQYFINLTNKFFKKSVIR